MELSRYVDAYTLERDLAESSVEQLKLRAKLLTEFAGGKLCLCELNADLVNRWLVSRQQAGLSPDTVHADRSKLLALWRAAADSGLCPPPGKVRRIKRPKKPVRAFTHDDVAKLLAVAEKMRGNIKTRIHGKLWDSGVSRRLYWLAFIRTAYDSALRRSDVLSIERDWIREHGGCGFISIVQSKTGRTITKRLWQPTMEAIDKLCGERKTGPIWQGYPTRRVWCQAFKRLCKRAGVSGSAKWLRRSSASYMAREHGRDAAKRHLGHSSDGVLDESYLDLTIAYPHAVMPPPLP